jgi:hypothetical protein
MSYHAFKDDDGNEYGSFEVFHYTKADGPMTSLGCESSGTEGESGWYWWPCFPGCMPDGEPNGPFETEQEAIDDAQEA